VEDRKRGNPGPPSRGKRRGMLISKVNLNFTQNWKSTLFQHACDKIGRNRVDRLCRKKDQWEKKKPKGAEKKRASGRCETRDATTWIGGKGIIFTDPR